MRAAMLPRVELVRPSHVIGTSTTSAMQSGIVYGYIGLVEGIVSRIQEELGEKTTVVATGGYADLIANETSIINTVNHDITLIGLKLIYDMNQT
jgi:type III pantothenate kinase